MCYLSVVSFVSRVSNIKNVVNSVTWTQRNRCCFLFPSKNVFMQTLYFICPFIQQYHFCFGCKNVYVMKYFKFFLCVCFIRKSEWTNSKAHSWHGMREIEMNDERCRVRARKHRHRHTHMQTPCMLYDATNIHSFIHSFISKYTLFERALQNDEKEICVKPSINYDWQPVDLKTGSLIK